MKIFIVPILLSVFLSSCLTLDELEKKRLKKIVKTKLDTSMKKVSGNDTYYVTYENKKAMFGAQYKLLSIKKHGAIDCGKGISIRRFTIYTYCGFELRFNYKGNSWRKPITDKHKVKIEKPNIKHISPKFIKKLRNSRNLLGMSDPLKNIRRTPLYKKYKFYIENRRIAKGLPREILPFIQGRRHKSVSKQIGVFGIRFQYDFGKKGCVYVINGIVDSWQKKCH